MVTIITLLKINETINLENNKREETQQPRRYIVDLRSIVRVYYNNNKNERAFVRGNNNEEDIIMCVKEIGLIF